MKKQVVILGASDDPNRYAFKALKLLERRGYKPILVNPRLRSIRDTNVLSSVSEISSPPDTLLMYVGPHISEDLSSDILKLKPRRVIFNPGSENPKLMAALKTAGVEVIENCSLVMLQMNHF